MAESVDALVSNTSGATHPGSSPGLGTSFSKKSAVIRRVTALFLFYGLSKGCQLFPTLQFVLQFWYLTTVEGGFFDALALLLAVVVEQAEGIAA